MHGETPDGGGMCFVQQDKGNYKKGSGKGELTRNPLGSNTSGMTLIKRGSCKGSKFGLWFFENSVPISPLQSDKVLREISDLLLLRPMTS